MKLEAAEWFILACQISFLPIVALLMRNTWSQRARAEALAGEPVLKVPRPHLKRWESAWLVVAWLVLFGEGAKCIYLMATRMNFGPSSRNAFHRGPSTVERRPEALAARTAAGMAEPGLRQVGLVRRSACARRGACLPMYSCSSLPAAPGHEPQGR